MLTTDDLLHQPSSPMFWRVPSWRQWIREGARYRRSRVLRSSSPQIQASLTVTAISSPGGPAATTTRTSPRRWTTVSTSTELSTCPQRPTWSCHHQQHPHQLPPPLLLQFLRRLHQSSLPPPLLPLVQPTTDQSPTAAHVQGQHRGSHRVSPSHRGLQGLRSLPLPSRDPRDS